MSSRTALAAVNRSANASGASTKTKSRRSRRTSASKVAIDARASSDACRNAHHLLTRGYNHYGGSGGVWRHGMDRRSESFEVGVVRDHHGRLHQNPRLAASVHPLVPDRSRQILQADGAGFQGLPQASQQSGQGAGQARLEFGERRIRRVLAKCRAHRCQTSSAAPSCRCSSSAARSSIHASLRSRAVGGSIGALRVRAGPR